MATRRLYYDDAYLKAFEAEVVACKPAGLVDAANGPVEAWEVVLDATAFYPASGGQPNDLGEIGGVVLFDVRDAGEEIQHIVGAPVALGKATCKVDWPRRFDHMQHHTGQHLLSAVLQEQFGLPTVSFHLGEKLCTIDLRGAEPSAKVLAEAQAAANQIVFEDRPVGVQYATAEELALRGVRKEVEREGVLRAVEILGADLQPCGGTHVRSTGQIGLILVRRCAKIRQDWRVEFACGARAERLATDDFQLLRRIGERLTCAPEEALNALQKAAGEREALIKGARQLVQQLAEAKAELLLAAATGTGEGRRVIAEIFAAPAPELLNALATELVKSERVVALLIDSASGHLVFAQHAAAGHNMQAVLRQVSATVACKGGGTKDFVRAKLGDAVAAEQALSLAKAFVAV